MPYFSSTAAVWAIPTDNHQHPRCWEKHYCVLEVKIRRSTDYKKKASGQQYTQEGQTIECFCGMTLVLSDILVSHWAGNAEKEVIRFYHVQGDFYQNLK